MRPLLCTLAALSLLAGPLSAQTADDVIAKYIARVGGMETIQAVRSLRRTGKFMGGGGFEAKYVQENKRPTLVREEFTLQGMTAINAWDGKDGWKINKFVSDKSCQRQDQSRQR